MTLSEFKKQETLRKHKRDEQPEQDSDDDFVTVKKHKKASKITEEESDDDFVKPVKIQKENKSSRNVPVEEDFFEFINRSLSLRHNIDNLQSRINRLSEEQKKDVNDMGFGSLLNMNIDASPNHLGYWLIKNYNPSTNVLNMGNHQLTITPSHVNEVFGIPLGGKQVVDKNKPRKGAGVIFDEFRNQFPTPKIYIKEVDQAIENLQRGGRLFKTNFLVMWNSIVGEMTKSTTINQSFIPAITDESEIKEYDWSSYMLNCLNRTREDWKLNTKGTEEQYNGPIALLQVLFTHEYLKRHNVFKVQAQTPAINYITSKVLFDMEEYLMNNGPLTDAEEDDEEEEENQNEDGDEKSGEEGDKEGDAEGVTKGDGENDDNAEVEVTKKADEEAATTIDHQTEFEYSSLGQLDLNHPIGTSTQEMLDACFTPPDLTGQYNSPTQQEKTKKGKKGMQSSKHVFSCKITHE